MVSKFLDPWNETAKSTKDYKWLESLQECEQKQEMDMARVEWRIDADLEEIKTLIKGMALQNNEIMMLITNQEGGFNRGSIFGNPAGVLDEVNSGIQDLKKLRQTGSLQDYMKFFELLLDKAHLGEE